MAALFARLLSQSMVQFMPQFLAIPQDLPKCSLDPVITQQQCANVKRANAPKSTAAETHLHVPVVILQRLICQDLIDAFPLSIL